MIASRVAMDCVRRFSSGMAGSADKSLVEITLKYYVINIAVPKIRYHNLSGEKAAQVAAVCCSERLLSRNFQMIPAANRKSDPIGSEM